MALLIALITAAVAAPFRAPRAAHGRAVVPQSEQDLTLVVKLAEDRGLVPTADTILGADATLLRLLRGAEPLFTRPRAALLRDLATADVNAKLADLSLYLQLQTSDAPALSAALLAHPLIEDVYRASDPVAPPFDIPPETPSFVPDQAYLGPGPRGLGFDIQERWSGALGLGVVVADVEYGFDLEHEVLNEVDVTELGHAADLYLAHGNGVLGMMAPGFEGFGLRGMLPEASYVVSYPFTDAETYNVADAINRAAADLIAGDILLIEQQGWVDGVFTPVEIEPAVFDAIATAVAQGIVVVEPAGNGACDLDDPRWGGWFDRETRDSGAIMVGGGSSPLSDLTPRSWFPEGSCYGSRVDVQGWFDSIVTASAADGAPHFVDLFFPDGDTRQAYTARFGGTSGAAPMVAAVAAAFNNFWGQHTGDVFAPLDLRAALISTGHPQQEDAGLHPIGPQPDLRRMLRTYGIR